MGWINRVGNQLAMDQVPRMIGDNITAKVKQWEETMKAEHGKDQTTFLNK